MESILHCIHIDSILVYIWLFLKMNVYVCPLHNIVFYSHYHFHAKMMTILYDVLDRFAGIKDYLAQHIKEIKNM